MNRTKHERRSLYQRVRPSGIPAHLPADISSSTVQLNAPGRNRRESVESPRFLHRQPVSLIPQSARSAGRFPTCLPTRRPAAPARRGSHFAPAPPTRHPTRTPPSTKSHPPMRMVPDPCPVAERRQRRTAGGRQTRPDVRDLGPDLQAVRLAADVPFQGRVAVQADLPPRSSFGVASSHEEACNPRPGARRPPRSVHGWAIRGGASLGRPLTGSGGSLNRR